jgi:hypothetical protein
VYAVTSFLGGFWYYLLDDDQLGYPVWYPAPVFDVVDGQVPSNWELGHHDVGGGRFFAVLSFPEWARDRFFYERLVDGDPAAVSTFERIVASLAPVDE